MVEIKFTDVERLILANQYEILGLLHKNDNYKRMAQTLRDGHEWLYSQFFDFLMPNLPESKTQHVLDILDIYSSLQGSYRKLTDKSGIDESDLVFPGFDGKHETELLSFANALRKMSTSLKQLESLPRTRTIVQMICTKGWLLVGVNLTNRCIHIARKRF